MWHISHTHTHTHAYIHTHTGQEVTLNKVNFAWGIETDPESMARAESRGSMRRRVTSGDMRSPQNLRKLAMAAATGERERERKRETDRDRKN